MSSKTADANNAVRRCPKCNSATTTIDGTGDGTGEGVTGYGKCHACGDVFDLGQVQSRVIFADLVDLPNPLADQHEGPQMAWKDVSDQPLIPADKGGPAYQVTSPMIDQPDVVKVAYVKGDEVGLWLVGGSGATAGGDPDFKISRQEMMHEKYAFTPMPGTEETHHNNTEPETTPGQSPDQVPPVETTDTGPADPHTSVASIVSSEDYDSETCRKCASTMVDHSMSSPDTTLHECVRCGSAWETRDEFAGREAGVNLAWLREDSDEDFHTDMARARAMHEASGAGSRDLGSIAAKDQRLQAIKQTLDSAAQQRTAGKNFSPTEKRALIDEYGVARNLEDLDLAGTHYDARWDHTGKANGNNVNPAHLMLGV